MSSSDKHFLQSRAVHSDIFSHHLETIFTSKWFYINTKDWFHYPIAVSLAENEFIFFSELKTFKTLLLKYTMLVFLVKHENVHTAEMNSV